MKNVVEVFTYGVITDRFLYSTKEEANSMYKALMTKHLGSPSVRVIRREQHD